MRGVLVGSRVMVALTLVATPAFSGFGSCQAKRALKVCGEFPVQSPRQMHVHSSLGNKKLKK